MKNCNHIVKIWILLDKSRYDRICKQVAHKGGESAICYTKVFQNAHASSVSIGISYSEDQLMQTFLGNFHQCVKYSSQIASHQAELRREEKFTNKKSLSISSLQTDDLNLDSSSGFLSQYLYQNLSCFQDLDNQSVRMK